MRTLRRRGERGYALSEAMVGGVVLLFAVSGVLAGFIQARADVSRATADRLAAQLGAAQVEVLRALPYAIPASPIKPLWILENGQQCSQEVRDRLPSNKWTCKVDVTEVPEPAVTGIVGARKYKRARITLEYQNRKWVTETLRW
jgi:Tfp pilus assembly protein PilV